jgi:hypothetical protein
MKAGWPKGGRPAFFIRVLQRGARSGGQDSEGEFALGSNGRKRFPVSLLREEAGVRP